MSSASRAALACLCLLLVACGGERTFEPSEFVDEANAEGAGLALGEPLVSTREGVDVYAVELSGESDGHGHGAGSLIVASDSEQAEQEFQRCEGAITLVCYRAANVVLALEGEPGAPELSGVDAAIRAMASD